MEVMNARRILLRVAEERDCPLFRVGDQMVLELPGVDRTASSQVCALALAELLRQNDLAACGEATSPVTAGEFFCPRGQDPVRFEVEALPELELSMPDRGQLIRDIPAAVNRLRGIPIFSPLPAQFLAQLAHRIREERYEDGDLILQKGQPGRAFFVVSQGTAEVVGFADQQVSSVVTRLREKDCFGEMSILTNTPVAASVVARGPVSLYVIDKNDFDLLLRENTFMAARFTRLIASRLVAANFRIVKEGQKSFSGKLSVMSLVTVVQVLADANHSGILQVDDHAGHKGKIGFNQGRIYDAQLGELSGEDAFYTMLPWDQGDFSLDASQVPTQDKLQTGVMNLVLEGLRRLDEKQRENTSSGGR